MKWGELPKEYQSIIIGCDYEDIDILEERFEWDMTKQGFDFWEKCHLATTIDELPPLPYDQCGKYVKDAEYKENALRPNNNLEKIKEMRDVVNDKDQDHLNPFYMIYVDGASGSTRKHDYESACKEAYRLSKETDKKVFILRSVEYFERNIEIKNTILLK